MPPDVDLFDAPHNQSITWEHLLRQTSDWQGTLWGKPDWADRPEGEAGEWPNRTLYEPGTHYKYNDVRVNVLALAALQVWRRPLPEVLREEIMEPIGASTTWRWYGYENSWVDIDGQKVQSVTGGGHWGGGMFINAWDMARFGYLFLRNGKWKDRQIVSEKWIADGADARARERDYGYANWYPEHRIASRCRPRRRRRDVRRQRQQHHLHRLGERRRGRRPLDRRGWDEQLGRKDYRVAEGFSEDDDLISRAADSQRVARVKESGVSASHRITRPITISAGGFQLARDERLDHRARPSVCGPGCATHWCSLPSNK